MQLNIKRSTTHSQPAPILLRLSSGCGAPHRRQLGLRGGPQGEEQAVPLHEDSEEALALCEQNETYTNRQPDQKAGPASRPRNKR